MSAYTRIRPARGLLARLWRALRICLWVRTGSLVRDLGPQAPTYRRRASVLYDHNTEQELPCGNNSSRG